jgi:hypothetical protein
MFKREHYADGDVVNQNNPTRRELVRLLSVWGPDLPKGFGDNKASRYDSFECILFLELSKI